jgi:hypothetical protein
MSGAARSSHRSTASSRAFSELTFQVAMRIEGQGSCSAVVAGRDVIEPPCSPRGFDTTADRLSR